MLFSEAMQINSFDLPQCIVPDISVWFNVGFLQTPSSLFVSVPVSCCPVFLVLLCQGPGTIFMCGLSWGMGSQVLLAFIPDFARAGPWAGMRNKLRFQGQNTGRGWLTLAEGAREKRDFHDD